MHSRKLFTKVVFVFFFSMAISGEKNHLAGKFDESEMSAYSESDDFSYMHLIVQPPTIWQRLKSWVAAFIVKIFSNPNTPWLSGVVFYSILLVVLGSAIFYILRLRYGGAISSESGHFKTLGGANEQSARGLDFEQLVNDSLRDQNHRLAIRYIYLRTLVFLSSKGKIKLKDWKSPYDYQNELNDEIAPPYAALTHLFEHVWYGGFNAGNREFDEGKQLAKKIEDSI